MKHYKLTIFVILLLTPLLQAERIKDIVTIKGERGNPLFGFGLVIGLDGTGDGSAVTKQAVASVLRQMNMSFTASDIDAANVASVFVTAQLGPFDRKGAYLDVAVSTIGGASSLQGGKLLMTNLLGADRRTYAIAQGSLALGGFGASGSNATVKKGHLTAGTIPNGAIVEREEIGSIVHNNEIMLLLRNPDHATAEGVAGKINTAWKSIAHAADAGTIRVKIPKTVNKKRLNQFIASIGKMTVKVDQTARVLINEKTGTIIVGQNVAISTVAIAHGSLTITTEELNFFSQPPPLSSIGATTEELQRTKLKATVGKGTLHVIPKQLTVSELAQALNVLGLTPPDIIAIFTALKNAGALQADLKTM